MRYKDALQKIDTVSVIEWLGHEPKVQGAYARFPCHECENEIAVKLYGDKKNLWYCPTCKKGGNLINLVMIKHNYSYEDAKAVLLKLSPTGKKIENELTLEYELQYTKEVADTGLTEEFCTSHQIGIPKGKTMLAGCLTFLISDEKGMKVAYYGIRLKNQKVVFHKSLNVELYLYGMNLCSRESAVVVSDIVQCALLIQDKIPAVCNFGLPYLSPTQIDLLNKIKRLDLKVTTEMAHTIATQLTTYYRFC